MTVEHIMKLADKYATIRQHAHYKNESAARAALLAAVKELAKDAECFRFWVREAACAPGDMAKLISKCITEQDYRDAIIPVATGAKNAIDAAMKGQS